MDQPPPPAVLAPAAPGLKHSWLGISSFVISIVGGGAMFLVIGVAAYMEASSPGSLDEKSAAAVFVGFALFGILAVHLVGAGLAIGGLVQKDRRKVFSVLGLVFNVLVILGTLVLMLLGSTSG